MATQIHEPGATRTTAAPAATETYAGAYARLNAIAERLKSAGAATGIDTLADDVRAARAAYATCARRLAAVRAEIDAELAAAAAETGDAA